MAAPNQVSFPSAGPPGTGVRHRIGVCSWSLQPASPADLVASLKPLRVDAVQLALSPIASGDAKWKDSIAHLRDAGIDILSGMVAMRGEDYSTLQSIARTGGVRPDEHWDANLALARSVAEIAARHRIGLVTFHAGFIPHDSADHSRGRMLDRLGTIADVFRAAGVNIAFETGQETALTLLDALEALNRLNVGVNFDPANMILYGMGDPAEALRLLAPRVRQIHIKDALPTRKPGTWGSETAAGAGAVDWPRFFDIALQIQPPVNFIIEREAGEVGGRERDIAAARELIAKHLQAGRCQAAH
ncbi:MAG TPA: sugar phosphate isomerase/epimerase family protein [Phycisphaerales bacterium]|nr:sugar phosphate isomerase/epimerase family protein [Phycisphaerales bacterium]